MKKLTLLRLFTLSLLLMVLAAQPLFAFWGGKDKKFKNADFEDQFMNKAQILLSHKEDLGLSKEQIDQIKNIKMEVKKTIISTDAEIEIVSLDIKQQMKSEDPKLEDIEKLIDQKYDLKKEKAKMLVANKFKLVNSLTDEQKEKMKSFFKKEYGKEDGKKKCCKLMRD